MKIAFLAISLLISSTVPAFTCSDLGVFATMMTAHKHNGLPGKKLVDAMIIIYGDDSDLTNVTRVVYTLPFEKKTPQEVYNFWADACVNGKLKEVFKKAGV